MELRGHPQSSTSTGPMPPLLTSPRHRVVTTVSTTGWLFSTRTGWEERGWFVPDSLRPENTFTLSLWWKTPEIF